MDGELSDICNLTQPWQAGNLVNLNRSSETLVISNLSIFILGNLNAFVVIRVKRQKWPVALNPIRNFFSLFSRLVKTAFKACLTFLKSLDFSCLWSFNRLRIEFWKKNSSKIFFVSNPISRGWNVAKLQLVDGILKMFLWKYWKGQLEQ